MEPPWEWEPSLWRLAPKAEALRLVLCLLLLGPRELLPQRCSAHVHRGGVPCGCQCCPKCSPAKDSNGSKSWYGGPSWSWGSWAGGQVLSFLRRDMKPPWRWRPPLRRLAPEAEALRLVLYLLLLGPHTAALPTCTEEEYPVGAQCCPKCSPGYHVKYTCGELTGTVCVPCHPGTYTTHHNGLSECLQCRVCEPAMGLVTRRNCSSTENTVCGCSQGHFCDVRDGDHCIVCRPHTVCQPGQKMLERGTESQDTMCQDCPPGTFSLNGTQEECQPWTRCDGVLETEEPGTSSTDATCSDKRPFLSLIIVIPIVFIPCIVYLCWKRRRSSGDVEASFQGETWDAKCEATVIQPLQPPQDVTTVAVEETAPAIPRRDPNR